MKKERPVFVQEKFVVVGKMSEQNSAPSLAWKITANFSASVCGILGL